MAVVLALVHSHRVFVGCCSTAMDTVWICGTDEFWREQLVLSGWPCLKLNLNKWEQFSTRSVEPKTAVIIVFTLVERSL